MTVCKSYDESTADDFNRLFTDRFPDGDAAILETFLANPARRDHPSTGAIAYDGDGSVKAILGLIPRRVYWDQIPIRVLNGVAIARRKNSDRDFFSDFIRDSILSDGADLYFVNTAIPPSRKRTALALEGLADGPASCGGIRERQLRSNGFFARVLRKLCRRGVSPRQKEGGSFKTSVSDWKGRALSRPRTGRSPSLPRFCNCLEGIDLCVGRGETPRLWGIAISWENEISDADFNTFWESYLQTNSGLVSSRTAEELRWMFGKGLSSGEVVLIAARTDGVLQGYAFCSRTDETATCWRVVDLIALGNDENIMEALIEGTSRFLRQCTPALCLQITGYPTWVQPLLKRLFPKNVSFGFNKCIWTALNETAKSRLGNWVNAQNGWYGCPYDGDMCLM